MTALDRLVRPSTFASLVLAATVTALSALTGCAGETDAEDGPAATEDELKKGSAEQWVYGGTMPRLENVNITVSLTAHTARVTGLLPIDADGALPYYAVTAPAGDRTEVSVVYPIATGAEVNSQGTAYSISRVSPWVPSDDKATWGGFPFIPYNRGIAFHGPITASDGQWKLIRGPVSHGCNRMQGEHIVELAHLLGVDMTHTVHSGAPVTGLNVPVKVIRVPDEWQGKSVDVNYPAGAGVQRPTRNVRMFPSWTADDLAQFVCALDKKQLPVVDGKRSKVIPDNYCAGKFTNRIDPVTGKKR